jgi:hypothetical protein
VIAVQFGIYPGSACGDDAGRIVTGAPDDTGRIVAALDALEADAASPLIVRAYTTFSDERGPDSTEILTPSDAPRLLAGNRRLDLVAQYQSRSGDIDGYARFVRNIVGRYGSVTATLQITEEPNVQGNPVLDGDYPGVLDAIVTGVAAANDEARVLGFAGLSVGVNTTPLLGPASDFYQRLVAAGGDSFIGGLGYVGLDMFPDVFRPVPDGNIRAATEGLLSYHRNDILAAAGLGHVPIRITEHGWPTGTSRSPERQAEVLREVIEAVVSIHDRLHVTAYELFSLRDADSAGPGLYHHFGIMTDAYEPKPAFGVFKDLLSRTSSP